MIGEKIRHIRKQSNMTQQELADKIGVSRQYISQIEKGVDSLSVKKLCSILDVLGFEIDFKSKKEK